MEGLRGGVFLCYEPVQLCCSCDSGSTAERALAKVLDLFIDFFLALCKTKHRRAAHTTEGRNEFGKHFRTVIDYGSSSASAGEISMSELSYQWPVSRQVCDLKVIHSTHFQIFTSHAGQPSVLAQSIIRKKTFAGPPRSGTTFGFSLLWTPLHCCGKTRRSQREEPTRGCANFSTCRP